MKTVSKADPFPRPIETSDEIDVAQEHQAVGKSLEGTALQGVIGMCGQHHLFVISLLLARSSQVGISHGTAVAWN
jgi:hypothetical protein